MHPTDDIVSASVVTERSEPSRAADAALLDDLVIANRILFDQGVVDAFGHVSVRDDTQPRRSRPA